MYYRSIKQMEDDYREKYGHLPDDPDEQLQYLYDNYKINDDKVKKEIERIEDYHHNIRSLTFRFNVIPTPAARPRSTKRGNIYVPGAKVHKDYFKEKVRINKIIHTEVKFKLDVYIPIPSSMSNTEKVLAQMGYIKPLSSPDWDNLAKTYTDMMLETLLLDDNLIVSGEVNKIYALKPYVKIYLEWYDGYDSKFNERRIEKSKRYHDYKSQYPYKF